MRAQTASNDFISLSIGSMAVVGLSFVLLTSSTDEADAQSRAEICKSLNSQLASVSSSGSGGNKAQFKKYDRAAKQQAVQIRKTKRIASRGRCTGFLKKNSAQCKRVVSSLQKMEANLRSLNKKRNQFAPKRTGSKNKRNRILRAIKQNRCNSINKVDRRQVKATDKKRSKRKSLLEQIFGTKTYNENGQRTDIKKKVRKENNNNNNGNNNIVVARGGTFRTLCVRKTDGYYFPISFSTVKDRFEQDEVTCQAMCPKSDVALYHHKMPSEDSEEMVSFASGKAYIKESFAFAYRKSFDISQKCRFATAAPNGGIEQVSVEKKQKAKIARIGTPAFKQDPTIAPDDHDLTSGKITLAKARGYLIDSTTDESSDENQLLAQNRKVRIVGPAFFPVQ